MEIKLHQKIYPEAAIKQTIEAFTDLASFNVSDQGDYYIVSVADYADDLNRLKAEFCNYVLSAAAVK